MDESKKIRLNNRLTYLAIGILVFCFMLTLALVILPRLPRLPDSSNSPGERRLFVSTWNFACTLMWAMVLRIQVFNGIFDSIKRKKARRGVTPWVKFWFIGSTLTGSATIIYVFHSFVTAPLVSSVYDVFTTISIVSWFALMVLTTLLFFSRGKCSKKVIPDVEKALPVHRRLLAPASVLFFLSTFLFPIFFLL